MDALLRATLLAALAGTLHLATAQQTFQRTYKATAVVTLFSVPIFSRSGVGYGSARVRTLDKEDGETIHLEFTGGSIPERAHGLNRFGYIQESIEEKHGLAVRATCFGMMTASREESLASAKAALSAQQSGQIEYVAALSRIENHQSQSQVRHLMLAAAQEGEAGELVRMVRTSFLGERTADPVKLAPAPVINTFLYGVRAAILSPAAATNREFQYNGTAYILRTEKHTDAAAEADMRQRGLLSGSAPVIQLRGNIENKATHKHTEFSLWYQAGAASVLPLRFEFRPKSYLKLVFDAEPAERPKSAPAMETAESPASFGFR